MRLNIALAASLAIAKILISGITLYDATLIAVAVAVLLGFVVLNDSFRPNPNVLKTVAWIGVMFLILFLVIVPTVGAIYLRQVHGPTSYVHDNPVQIEAAVNFLSQGKNPYQQDYTATPLAEWNGGYINEYLQNPSLYHVVALPGHLLTSFLLMLPSNALLGFYDERFLYLIAFIAMLVLASRLGRTPEQRLRSIILLGLNPLVIHFFIFGRNDVLIFTALLAAFFMLLKRRSNLAAILFGFACTIKLFALAFAPLFLTVLIARQSDGPWRQRLRQSFKPLALLAITFLVITLPFVIWDAPSFYDDIVRYTNGTSATSYPVAGLGLAKILLELGVIRSATDYYPFWIFQLIFVLPMLVWFIPKLAKHPKVSLMVFTGTLVLFVGLYVSRFMNDNYFSLISLLLLSGYGFHRLEHETPAESSPRLTVKLRRSPPRAGLVRG